MLKEKRRAARDGVTLSSETRDGRLPVLGDTESVDSREARRWCCSGAGVSREGRCVTLRVSPPTHPTLLLASSSSPSSSPVSVSSGSEESVGSVEGAGGMKELSQLLGGVVRGSCCKWVVVAVPGAGSEGREGSGKGLQGMVGEAAGEAAGVVSGVFWRR